MQQSQPTPDSVRDLLLIQKKDSQEDERNTSLDQWMATTVLKGRRVTSSKTKPTKNLSITKNQITKKHQKTLAIRLVSKDPPVTGMPHPPPTHGLMLDLAPVIDHLGAVGDAIERRQNPKGWSLFLVSDL